MQTGRSQRAWTLLQRQLWPRLWSLPVLVGVLIAGGCPSDRGRQRRDAGAAVAADRGAGCADLGPGATEQLPAADDEEQLVHAHYLVTIAGDVERSRELLTRLLRQGTTSPSVRARAALQLAELAVVAGDRKQALVHLEQAKEAAGPGDALALEADDRRARILTATPLADVRGPVPGTVIPRGEGPAVVAAFRRAEQRLAYYHRVVVAPQLENINEVLRNKRRALRAASAAYQGVVVSASGAARVAALFRLGAIYHHMAEALAFAIPPELLPSVARQLRHRLQGESAQYLRRALSYYREAASVPVGPGTSPWRPLAQREAKTLALVLKSTRRRSK